MSGTDGVGPTGWRPRRSSAVTLGLLTAISLLILPLIFLCPAKSDELYDAVRSGNIARVEAALAPYVSVSHADLDGSNLHLAVISGNLQITEALLTAGVDIEAKGEPFGAHPIHTAAYGDRVEATDLLLEWGAQVGARDQNGRTPLMVAALFGSFHLVKLLLTRGADAKATDNQGISALQYAAKANNVKAVKLLLQWSGGAQPAS